MTEVVAQDMIILTPKGDRVPPVEADDLDMHAVGSVPRRTPAPGAPSEAISNGPARQARLASPAAICRNRSKMRMTCRSSVGLKPSIEDSKGPLSLACIA